MCKNAFESCYTKLQGSSLEGSTTDLVEGHLKIQTGFDFRTEACTAGKGLKFKIL